MGRIRTIKPEFFTHEGLSTLDAETHLFAAGLLCYADDYGYFNANPGLVKAAIFPLRETSVSVPEMLRRLHENGFLVLGTGSDKRHYGQVIHFDVHQRVSHPTDSKISKLEIAWQEFGNPPENFGKPPELFRQEGKGKELGKEQGKEVKTELPSWLDLSAWNAFVDMRKKIRKPLTDHAKDLAVARLADFRERGNDPTVILENSILNSYQGLFEPTGGSNGTQINQSRKNQGRSQGDGYDEGGEVGHKLFDALYGPVS